MICLLFTLTKSDPSSEHQPRPLRVRRSPRSQFCSDLNDAGVNEICTKLSAGDVRILGEVQSIGLIL